MTASTDPVAASIHAEHAERHYAAAERFRKLGLRKSEADARRFARMEDDLSYMLRTGREPRRGQA